MHSAPSTPSAAPQIAPSVKSQVSSGLFWSAAGRIVQQIAQFALSAFLARLLSPEDFGVVAMAAVFTGFATMLSDAGFSTALIQRKSLTEQHIHTVFWINAASNVFVTLIIFFAAPSLAAFYKTPVLVSVFRVTSLNFLIASFGSVHGALLQKEMLFKEITKISTAAVILSGLVGVSLAFLGAGIWSLVAQSIVSTVVLSVLRWSSYKWRPRFQFCVRALKELFGFASHLYSFNLLNYWSRNGDNLLIGKFFGASVLGAYNRAYLLMLLPITQFSSIVTAVLFPAFSSLQDDKKKVRQIYLRAVSILSLISFPAMIGLGVVAEPFVVTVYGPQWRAAAPLLQMLAVVGVMQIVGNSVGWLFFSQGKTNIMLAWGAVYSLLVVAGLGIGAVLGSVQAIVVSYIIVNLVLFYPELNAAAKLVGSTGLEVLSAVSGSFFSSAIMGAVVWMIGRFVPAEWHPWQRLLLLTLAGVAVYLSLVRIARLHAFYDLIKFVQDRRSQRNQKTVLLSD